MNCLQRRSELRRPRLSAGSALGRGVFQTLGDDRPLTDSESLTLWAWMFAWMRNAWSEPPVAIVAADTGTDDVDVRAYFAPGFAVLFLLFTMLASAKTIHEEREAGTYDVFAVRANTTFTPTERTVTVPPNATGQDFQALTKLPEAVDLRIELDPRDKFSNEPGRIESESSLDKAQRHPDNRYR